MKELKSLIYEEKRSKFIALLYHIDEEKDVKEIEKQLEVEYKKANHILKALRYQNHFGVFVSVASDDKEPISSMKKTRELMERKDYQNIAIYIVRYYGGTNLGASRLDHVYFTLATNLLKEVNNKNEK